MEDAMKYPILAAGFCAVAGMAAAETPVLTVYTYDSFVSDWGPGPAVEKAFEKTCGCDLQFVTAGDGAAKLDLPIEWTDPTFVPFDWGWFAFVYDKTRVKQVPHSFRELADSKLKVVIEDPRSSTPGLGLLLWVKDAYGDKAADIWKGLADNIVTVTPGWSEAYGLFLKGEADMVLSYTTSPAYHLIAEQDDSKAAAPFDEGHYMEVEVAGKLATSQHPQLADEFLKFITSDAFQSVIPETNWMYPAVTPKAGLPKGFETLLTPAKTLLYPADQVPAIRKEALEEWRAALSQ
jgi:thiamine transport system substrate-binding protein